MSFRRRMILLAAGAVATAVVIASVVVYIATRNELRGQLDASLRQKLTPGQPQAVQVRSAQVSAAALRTEQARLSRALARLGKSKSGSHTRVGGDGGASGQPGAKLLGPAPSAFPSPTFSAHSQLR